MARRPFFNSFVFRVFMSFLPRLKRLKNCPPTSRSPLLTFLQGIESETICETKHHEALICRVCNQTACGTAWCQVDGLTTWKALHRSC